MTHIPNLDTLLDSEDVNSTIIELDNFIGDLCAYGDELDNLSGPQRLFYLNQTLEREVNNGGFDQYFLNSSGDHALETISALAAVGAYRTRELLQMAINEFPNQLVPGDRGERQELMSFLENGQTTWDILDQQFFKYEDDLNALNIQYVKENKELF